MVVSEWLTMFFETRLYPAKLNPNIDRRKRIKGDCRNGRICSSGSGGRDQVYVAAIPLRASIGPAQFLLSTAYSLNSWELQHFMVIVKPSSSALSHNKAVAYDFQPKEPENISTAVAALFGREVSGVVLVRKMDKLPRRKCWFVGYSNRDNLDAAHKFNENWETGLRIGQHDCRNYSQELVEYLTGEKFELEYLKKSNYI